MATVFTALPSGGQDRQGFGLKTSPVKFEAKEYIPKGFRAKHHRAILGA
jgi:hypothetical protein